MLYATSSSSSSSSFSIADINISDYFDKVRLSATRTWLRVINVLVSSNATWDKTYRDANKSTQLHLLLSNFPPSIIEKDFNLFMSILTSCLDEGTSISTPDGKGNTCLFTVSYHLSTTTTTTTTTTTATTTTATTTTNTNTNTNTTTTTRYAKDFNRCQYQSALMLS
jgi:hypothetical protein